MKDPEMPLKENRPHQKTQQPSLPAPAGVSAAAKTDKNLRLLAADRLRHFALYR
jgi:hypothetical protein